MKSSTTRVQRPRRCIRRAQRVRLQGLAASRRRTPAGASRRDFLKQGAGVGLVMGLPPLLAACGSDDDRAPTAPPGKHLRTLFFNLSHEAHAGKTYYLTGGGQRLALTPVAERPQVLQAARQRNAFLRAVPDDQITHHVEDAVFADDSVTLCYVSADIDVQAGTWSMSSVQLYIPSTGAAQAFAAARRGTAVGPLPLSAKRRHYGVQPAQSAQDLSDERELLDIISHAGTMVGCHPDLMSLEPNSAHTVHSNHIDPSIDIRLLIGKLNDSRYGAALPAQTPGQPNASGWATLQPLLDGGVPLKNEKGQHKGRVQYLPSTHPDLRPLAGSAMAAAIPQVRNDTSLGADITGISPGDSNDPPNPALAGILWMRHDGLPHIDQSPGKALANAGAAMALKEQNGQVGYRILATSTQAGAAIKVELSVLNFFLQFRGIWLQFLDANGKVIELTKIDEYNKGTIINAHDKSQDTEEAMFIGMIGPAFAVWGITVAPGFTQPSFNVPAAASTVRILSSGLSFEGGNTYPETVLAGAIMTGIFNYGITVLLAALGGASLLPAMYKAVVIPVMQTLALELTAMVNAALNPNGDPVRLVSQFATAGFWEQQAATLAKALLNVAAGVDTKALMEWVFAEASEAAVQDSVPVVGQAMQAVSIAVGAIVVAETSAELALTPWTYVADLAFTHDLSVTILKDSGDPNADPPDPGDDTFPKGANSYTVTAMFDDGTPYTQTLALAAPVPATLPPVVFQGVPLGGNVNISVAFVQKATTPGQPDILLGKGSTGLIPNNVETVSSGLSFAIEELQFPISANTVYQHRQKTALDAQGHHVWAAGPAPTVNQATAVCGGAGTVCGWRSLSVRQGTGSVPGYLGYAWQAQNSDPARAPSCVGGGAGQLDQVANLNTSSGHGGSDAQLGYANGACGIGTAGVKVAYSLLGHSSANFYLDTTDPAAPTLRQVTLDPTPAFDSPRSGRAWGVLNLSSDALLLHPAGHVVSINQTHHRIETHKLPAAPMADADAKVQLIAQLKSGKGSRPGLIDSPVAAAVSPDGVILLLEVGNNRIQAFDLGANPVRHFVNQGSPYSLTLGGTDPAKGWQYLDLAVEYTGYMYVLSYNQGSFIYRLDIYHPQQSGSAPIATTQDVNAARLAVDFWRNVYTLNYEVLQLPGGAPAGLTEPSVSLWTPCAAGQTC